jgi:predicted nucleotidyltransferase component of viral defense system
LNAELTPELCVDVADALGLPHPGLVEKDYHVVRALQALKEVEYAGARLIFGGGTSLCRAHRLIERMSEDIDLRIASSEPLTDGGRRRFRAVVSESLIAAGFEFDPKNRDHLAVHDGGKMFVFNLPYAQATTSVASLRPGVKVEISSWPILRASVQCTVSSFVAQARGVAAEVSGIQCVDVTETAADKFVALTRRIGEEQYKQLTRDRSLLRHVYDLYRIRSHVTLDEIRPLIGTIMESDRRSRSNGFPAYADNPQKVSRDAIKLLAKDASYAEAFEGFQRDMVYGARVTLYDCIPVLRELVTLL